MNADRLDDTTWMRQALALAQEAANLGEVPIGALLVRDGQCLAAAHNQPIRLQDPTAHAEVCVLRQAAQKANNYRLPGATLYVTVEPCLMCVGALTHARVQRVVFGCREPKAGALISQLRYPEDFTFLNHKFNWSEGILGAECQASMQDFFRQKRN